jgi:hypothetical protein
MAPVTTSAEPDIALPDSPTGRAAAWFIAHVRDLGAGLTDAEVREHMLFREPWDPANSIERFRTSDPRPFRIEAVKEPSPTTITVRFDYGDDRPFAVTLEVEPDAPHRITWVWWGRAIADEIVIRQAGADDAPALNQLEVRAPMTLGTSTLVYDRGTDFLGFSRLMAENVCFVAERDGELMGLACGAAHDCRVGGEIYRVMLLHHLRVPVEHRKEGIFSTLNGYVFATYDGRTDGAYGYTAIENEEAMRIGGPGTWDAGVWRAIVPCEPNAGPAHGRSATPADAPAIVAILNECHDREEMYLPYTVESLTARLERAPDLYTWGDIVIGDGAVLGVWPAGLSVTFDDGTGPVESTRAVTLDHGFVSGAEDELEHLLRSTCAALLARGHTEVMFLTSEGSPHNALIQRLATKLDPFAFRMAVPEPEGTVERGLYVDPIYF